MKKIIEKINEIQWLKQSTNFGFVIVTLIILTLSLLGSWAIAAHYSAKPVAKTIIQDPNEPKPYLQTNFSAWPKTNYYFNDLNVVDGQLFKLDDAGYRRQKSDKIYHPSVIRDPQGYIETPVDLSENSLVCSKIKSLTPQIDFSTRLNKKLQVITGDGDDQTVALKLVTNDGIGYVSPDRPQDLAPGEVDYHVDDQGRFHLDKKLPIGEAFVNCIQVVATKGGQSQNVTVQYVVLDGRGNKIDMGAMPKWTVNTPTEINGTNRFSIGLIDSRNAHPVVEVQGFCAVEMKDFGDHPSERELNACIFP